tara:strand:+ start:171 stop:1214 length:1044 start_codon:yes stop_codon:yes gene_type:complete
MVTRIGTHFPLDWAYGKDELYIFDKTESQIDKNFPNDRNLLINTTWFGSQFDNAGWKDAMDLEGEFANLFLLCVIDPQYLFEEELQKIIDKYNIKNIYRIGMYEGEPTEWNFHAIVANDRMPQYKEEEVLMQSADFVYMLYQRKPRLHRVEITNILREQPHLLERGIVTLGGVAKDGTDWQQGLEVVPMTIDDLPSAYKQTDGDDDDHAGVPNDLVTIGRLDLWQNHFLNVVSETEFDEWKPVFMTEKIWKPMIGLRPFHVHGNPRSYQWLRDRGFKTFNHYWKHLPVETVGQHDALMSVINYLVDMPKAELEQMYLDMLPDLRYNKARLHEFSKEQKYKMENIFNA